ncbi:MAG: methyltransferase domain-containing protein [Clostridiaceae bacterium]|nr:methyltransferase domain-containing protein [Clostridiaceae bacterium]
MDHGEIYGGFASVYDRFMDNIPYDEWVQFLHRLLKKYGVEDGIVADLACGTGEITRRLETLGYDMIGVDLSQEMLNFAREKCGADVLLLCQDIRELDLYGSVAAMVCLCDGMNYLCSEQQLEQVFSKASLFLDSDGVFIFDMKTDYFYREILGDSVFAENREDASYIWENVYDRESKINEYFLTVYELEDERRGLFRRAEEIHRQRAYSVCQVREAMERQGLSCIEVLDASGAAVKECASEKNGAAAKENASEKNGAASENTERIYFVAKKYKKQK